MGSSLGHCRNLGNRPTLTFPGIPVLLFLQTISKILNFSLMGREYSLPVVPFYISTGIHYSSHALDMFLEQEILNKSICFTLHLRPNLNKEHLQIKEHSVCD